MIAASYRTDTLQNILNRYVDNKVVFGVTACVKTNNVNWCGKSGNFEKDEQFFIASTTKLFITAILLILRRDQRIRLDDPISKYLSAEIMNNLHVFNGVNYSDKLTIKHLMAHTSGMPDYFLQQRANGKSLEVELLQGNDQHWSFEKVVADAKEMATLFKPGQSGKAHYSDTNYQLLGAIIENVYDKKLESIIDELIVQPLGLQKTFLYCYGTPQQPKNIYYRHKELHIPKAMSSFRADGGMVSTANELMIFIEAFFKGKLFPMEFLPGLNTWNKIFYPLQSGIGLQQFKLPWFFSPFKRIPELIGHSGLSGTFAFYSPEHDIYLTGTVNQIYKPGTSFRLMIKLLNAVID